MADDFVLLTFPDAPRVELDRRLADLVEAANEVLATQGRLRALLRANQAVVSQLELPSVLQRIVSAATQLASAKYGGLTLLGQDGEVEDFVQVGVTEAEKEAIGTPPHVVGILRELLEDPHPIRLARLADHPRFEGLPSGHPEIVSFLGVPITARGRIYGDLYLADPAEDAFTEEDEQLIRSLAATAAFAIENARLYSETRRRQAWASASAEITAQLLHGGDARDALALIAARVMSLSAGDNAYVALLNDDMDVMTFVEAQGEEPVRWKGFELPTDGTLMGEVIHAGRPTRLTEAELKERRARYADRYGPMMIIPLATPARTLGALLVTRLPGGRSFTEAELELAADFAGRASVALELGMARSDQERMLLFEERGRIARELHDRVIQLLFGTGLQLQNVLAALPPGRSSEQVDAAIAGVDEAIAQIRRIIFTLSSSALPGQSTGRRRLLDLVMQLASRLSIEPTLTFEGPVDGVVDDGLAEDVLAVVSEAITNAVKHGSARQVSVTVSADGRGVTVSVTNDGRPFKATRRRSGLANLEERARRRGGSTTIGATADGTRLTWQVPVGGDRATSEDTKAG